MVAAHAVDLWFVQEVLPLEAALTRFLRRNWREESDILDLRQELYTRVYESALNALPAYTRGFVFTAARNLLIDQVRRARIVAIDAVADLDTVAFAVTDLNPEREVTARDELRRFQAGLDRLPARCREVVVLRKIEGLSQRQTAERMGIREDTVERQMQLGMRALADFMLGGPGLIRRRHASLSRSEAVPAEEVASRP
jgi:RNA polymerase sigma factor (sigma-70 family)